MIQSELQSEVARSGPRVRRAGSLVAAFLAVFGLLLGTARTAQADLGDYRISDAAGVYLGNQRLFCRPCVIQADRVYRSIAEYREILEKGLTDKDVRYHFLMKKASERFLEAVKTAAKELDVDLVAEVGAVKAAKNGVNAPSDKTDTVIAKLT